MQDIPSPTLIQHRLANVDWKEITQQLHNKGFSNLNHLLSDSECDQLKGIYTETSLFRKTIVMERYRFGLGEYKYFNYPLPDLLQSLRQHLYPYLAPVANTWMEMLKLPSAFPTTHQELLTQCQDAEQTKPTLLILKYGRGGFNTLHQDLYGEVYFPLQCVLFLSDTDRDYSGGEFVMTQQTPRAQSKAIVLRPAKGDLLIFTTNFRPVKSSKGYYRAAMKHGVSEVREGERYTLGIIFHDALS